MSSRAGPQDCALDAQTLVPAAQDAEAARRRRNKLLGSAASVLLFFGIIGFIPSYYVGLKDKEWYFDGVNRQDLPPARHAASRWGERWRVLVLIHAITALLWTILGVVQVATGATGQPGGRRKRWHRINGYFAACLALLVVIEAVVLQFHKELSGDYVSIMGNAFMILANLGIGIRSARAKEFTVHKSAMAWTCAWTAAPGMTRVTAYLIIVAFGGCRVDSIGYFAIGAIAILLAVMYAPVVRLKELKSKVTIFNLSVSLLIVLGNATTSTMKILHEGWCSPL